MEIPINGLLFNILFCKILYPNNTEREMDMIFTPCKSFDMQKEPVLPQFGNIYKNPNYTNIVFVVSNSFLFHNKMTTIWQRTSTGIFGEIMDEVGYMNDIYYTAARKYQFLKKNLNNTFKNIDNEIIDIFRVVQKNYNAFARFAHIWRHNKSKIQIEHDLYMTPLVRGNRNVFSLLQQGNIYLFTASNLVSSINASLMNAPNFFVEPLVLKNPYTNVPFQKSDLYNIYFFLKQSPILMPILFHNYFLADFNLRIFRDDNETTIRDIYIRSVIRNSVPDSVYFDIGRMLKKYQPKIIIDNDFPKDILAKIMIPYLELYYIIKYSTEEYKVIDANAQLLYKLHKLHQHNPGFGRKIVSLKREGLSKKMVKTITFNDKHIPFNEPVHTDTYQKTHLELIEANYTIENDTPESESEEPVNYETTQSDDTIQYGNYSIITTQPSLYMTDNPFIVVGATLPEYIESENETDDDIDEVVIENSSHDEDSDTDTDTYDIEESDEDI